MSANLETCNRGDSQDNEIDLNELKNNIEIAQSSGCNLCESQVNSYKEYKYPGENILKLAKEEFDDIVELFRLLLNQDQLNNNNSIDKS